jgi:hypothetical protein
MPSPLSFLITRGFRDIVKKKHNLNENTIQLQGKSKKRVTLLGQ